MKLNKIFLVILVICFVTSCKITKETQKTDLKVNTAANLTVKEASKANLDIKSNFSNVERNIGKELETDNSTVNETIEESTTKTDLSAPDSTGRQWPTSITTTNKRSHRGENKNVNKASESNISRDSKGGVSDKSDYKSAISVKDKGKTAQAVKSSSELDTKTETPGFITVIALVAGLLGIALIYYLLKRFGVIK